MPTRLLASLCVLLAATACTSTRVQHAREDVPRPFMLGADVSWLPEDEAAGATYFDGGIQKDLLVLLHDRGFDAIRLRVFVDPKAEGGYARRGREAWCDLPHTLAMARRIKALGMGLVIDLQYSDTWADPEHQTKPRAWRDLPFDELVDAARRHTADVVGALVEQGTPPDIVQVGNEITHGLLWPDARVASLIPSGNAETDRRMQSAGIVGLGHYDGLAAVLKTCIAEVRRLCPSTQIALHHHLGRSTARVQEWLTNLLSRGVRFDIVGFSCYAQGKEGDWQRTFADVAANQPDLKIAVLEYSTRKRYLNDLVRAIPGGRGVGTFAWEPTRHREALFDKNGKNAGGGQASDFINDLTSNQGLATRPATAPATTRAATTRSGRLRNNGGRYDANAFIDLYPQMRRDFAR